MKILLISFKTTLLFFVCIIFFSVTEAQVQDSSSLKNTLKKFTGSSYKQNFTERSNISYRSFVIPSFMIAYGFTTLSSDGLKDINEGLQNEYREESHKKIHADNYLQFAPAAAVYALNLAGIKGKNNFRDRSIIYVISNVFLNGSVTFIKKSSHEQRPDASSYMSFPSGHTAEAFASAEFLRQEYKDVSPWYGLAGYAAATATGLLRIYNNKHWLSDVVAGAGVGIASTKLAYWLYPSIKRKFFHDKNVSTMFMPYYQNNTVGLSMVHQFH